MQDMVGFLVQTNSEKRMLEGFTRSDSLFRIVSEESLDEIQKMHSELVIWTEEMLFNQIQKKS
jgi:hypothetical protein